MAGHLTGLISNESTYQRVIPDLEARIPPGDVYVGVGPDQNLTYICALRPSLGFIVDIRREVLLLHLLYKALAELSGSRTEFLSRLFGRALPVHHCERLSITELVDRCRNAAPSPLLWAASRTEVASHLLDAHGFPLDPQDLEMLQTIQHTLYTRGPELTYSGGARDDTCAAHPTYADQVSETDAQGRSWSYLSSESAFITLKNLHERNSIVPIVGSVAGPKTLRALGEFLRSRAASISTFYTSNVEQYLFARQGDWHQFVTNVRNLPVHRTAVLIRSGVPRRSFTGGVGLKARIHRAVRAAKLSEPYIRANAVDGCNRPGTIAYTVRDLVAIGPRVHSYEELLARMTPSTSRASAAEV